MNRTSRGFLSVSDTNSSSSSSLRPRITTQFTYRGRQSTQLLTTSHLNDTGETRQPITKCLKKRKSDFD